MRNKWICAVSVCILFLCVFFSGCAEVSDTIEITVESYSPYEATGSIFIDGIWNQNFTLDMFNSTVIIINKSTLSQQEKHTVSVDLLPLKEGDDMLQASCETVTEKVSFVVSIDHQLNRRSCT